MSKAFTRESDSDGEEPGLPPLPAGGKNYITPEGYAIVRTPSQAGAPERQETWLSPTTQAHIQPNIQPKIQPPVQPLSSNTGSATRTDVVVLGPEPIIAPVSITLSLTNTAVSGARTAHSLRIATDGLAPFQVMP